MSSAPPPFPMNVSASSNDPSYRLIYPDLKFTRPSCITKYRWNTYILPQIRLAQENAKKGEPWTLPDITAERKRKPRGPPKVKKVTPCESPPSPPPITTRCKSPLQWEKEEEEEENDDLYTTRCFYAGCMNQATDIFSERCIRHSIGRLPPQYLVHTYEQEEMMRSHGFVPCIKCKTYWTSELHQRCTSC